MQFQHLRDLSWVNSHAEPRSVNTYPLKENHLDPISQCMVEILKTVDTPVSSSSTNQNEIAYGPREPLYPKVQCTVVYVFSRIRKLCWIILKALLILFLGVLIFLCCLCIYYLFILLILVPEFMFPCVAMFVSYPFGAFRIVLFILGLLHILLLLLILQCVPWFIAEGCSRYLMVACWFWVCFYLGIWLTLLWAYIWDRTVVERCVHDTKMFFSQIDPDDMY